MPNPFSSEYVSSNITGGDKKNIIAAKSTEIIQVATAATTPSNAESLEFGFDPHRYGLGKPKRVVIRGKITHG